MTLGFVGFVFFALFFVFVGWLTAPFVSIDDWIYDKYTRRGADNVKQTVRDELVELGVIDADTSK